MNARQRAVSRHVARTARTPRHPESAVPRRHGTKTASAGRPGGSAPAPSQPHEPSAFEVAAARAYTDGRREQRCPDCGREEAGGSHCSFCLRPVHPDEWTNDTAKSRAGRAANAAKTAGQSPA